jgi:hypothetical protein
VDVVGRNKLGELMFIVPNLLAGDYTLEVRATIHGSQDVRTGALDAMLTVAQEDAIYATSNTSRDVSRLSE